MRIRGRRVLVTGASSGIGRATALALARRGAAEVIAVARSRSALEALATEHPAIRPLVADLADREGRRRVASEVRDVDVLVNNAGIGVTNLVEELSDADVRRLYEVNVLVPIELTRAALPGMLERRRGRVVNISSASAWVSTPPLTLYSSTKWALQGFSEGLRREVTGRGVAVATVNPGPIRTRFAESARAANRPSDELPDRRMPGMPVAWVAAAVVRAVRFGAFPGYGTIAVPRLVGLSRLGAVPVLAWTVDLAALAVVRLRRRGVPAPAPTGSSVLPAGAPSPAPLRSAPEADAEREAGAL